VAPRADGRHRAGVRHGQHVAPLEPTEQDPGVEPAFVGQRWALHDPVELDQRFVGRAHNPRICHIRHTVKGRSSCPRQGSVPGAHVAPRGSLCRPHVRMGSRSVRAERIGGVIRLREARCRSVGERGDGAVGVGHLGPAVEGVAVAKSTFLRRKEAKEAASRKPTASPSGPNLGTGRRGCRWCKSLPFALSAAHGFFAHPR